MGAFLPVPAVAVTAGMLLVACAGDSAITEHELSGGDTVGAGDYAYSLREMSDGTFRTEAVTNLIAPGAPVTGDVNYSGTYELFWAEIGDSLTGIETETGDLALSFDFDTATLTGAAGDLTLVATVADAGITFNGTATFRGATSDEFFGIIGIERAVGVFERASGPLAFAGGFNLTATP